MRYEEHPPPADVAPWVACLWTLTGRGDGESFELILPDGRPELVVHRGDPFRRKHASGAVRAQARRLVVGQMSAAVALAPGRRVETVGVRFTPAGLAPLCPFPQARLVDRIARVEALEAPLVRGIAATVSDASTLASALSVLAGRLTGAYAEVPPLDVRVQRAVTRITASGGTVAMDELTADVGRSSRWLERRFLEAVGVSPKRLARLVRFRRAMAALDANPTGRGAAVALDHGYYDQAHFIAEFRAFAGDAPRRFVEHRLATLTRYFVDRQTAP